MERMYPPLLSICFCRSKNVWTVSLKNCAAISEWNQHHNIHLFTFWMVVLHQGYIETILWEELRVYCSEIMRSQFRSQPSPFLESHYIPECRNWYSWLYNISGVILFLQFVVVISRPTPSTTGPPQRRAWSWAPTSGATWVPRCWAAPCRSAGAPASSWVRAARRPLSSRYSVPWLRTCIPGRSWSAAFSSGPSGWVQK